jgi:hypothetical protein
VELLDHPKMIGQFAALECTAARGGKAKIDHPPGGHDDIANAVAGVVALGLAYGAYDHSYRGWQDNADSTDPAYERAHRARRWMDARVAEISRPPQPPWDMPP